MLRCGPLGLLVASLFAVARGASLTSLTHKASGAEQLKSALFGGACWVIACTDAGDGGSGQSLLERAMDESGARDVCGGATLKCEAKLPSGSTAVRRLGLAKPPEGHPLLFVAANGEATALALAQYAVVDDDGKRATPDAKTLAATIAAAGAPPKPTTLRSDAAFQTHCAEKRHCLAVFVNSTASDADAVRHAKKVAARVARTRRTLRVVVADAAAVGAFSLAKALPRGAATALYLRNRRW